MSGPGRAHRQGISLLELADIFPTEEVARDWFVRQRWPDGRFCPRCGSTDTTAPGGVLAYWCPACRRRFSVTSGTALERTRLPLRKWVVAIYLFVISIKGVSSMRLHRDLGITQRSAWFVLHRLRLAFADVGPPVLFLGPVEVDETYMGGKRKNMSNAKRKALAGTGRGTVGKTAVVGMKDRATNAVRAVVVADTAKGTLQDFVRAHAAAGATLYTDEHGSYSGMDEFRHEAVNHSVKEFVREMAHTNGIESFWAMLKRAHTGTFHKMSPQHLQRYVDEFAGRHNIRDADTLAQMTAVIAGLVGKRLLHRDLTRKF